MVVLTLLPLPIALLADRIGRKPILLSGAIGIVVLSWPLFWFMHYHSPTSVLIGQLGFAVLFSWIFAANPATMAEILPRHVRVSAMSIGYKSASRFSAAQRLWSQPIWWSAPPTTSRRSITLWAWACSA